MLIYDTGMQNGDEAAGRIQNVENYVKLKKNMQIEIINNTNILKTLYRNFARPAGVHYM